MSSPWIEFLFKKKKNSEIPAFQRDLNKEKHTRENMKEWTEIRRRRKG